MRISAQILCLAASLAAAPAFAQTPAQPQSSPQAQKSDLRAGGTPSPQFNFGLGLSKDQSEPTLLPIAPIQKDSVALSWKPFNNWDVTLGVTQRSQNELFPREEVTAGVTYQVTPRFRLGGGVTVKGDSLAESLASPATSFTRDANNEASVRIESAFSF